jgi:L-lactate dehydrogenase complex protein LldE
MAAAAVARAVRGINLVEIAGLKQCCGFGGKFAVKNAEIQGPYRE